MANHVRVLDVSDEDRAELEQRVRSKSALAKDVQRARIVLLSAEGYSGWTSLSAWAAQSPR